MADGVSTRVILRVGEGHARRNRGAPTPRPAPRARIQEPTFPWRTVASRRLLALAPVPTADRPPQSTASAQAQRLACRARPAPRQAWGRRWIQALLLLVRDKLGGQSDRGEGFGRPKAAA